MNDREPQEIEATGQTSGSKGDATRDVEDFWRHQLDRKIELKKTS